MYVKVIIKPITYKIKYYIIQSFNKHISTPQIGKNKLNTVLGCPQVHLGIIFDNFQEKENNGRINVSQIPSARVGGMTLI